MKSNNKIILIVDDDKELLDRINSIFTSNGYDVFSAHNGMLGLKTAKSIRPDLIITDICMPIMDGVTMLKNIREDALIYNTPVIIFSSLTNKILLKYSLEFSAQEYLNKKESNPEDLLKVASKYLNN